MSDVEAKRKIEKLVGNCFPRARVMFTHLEKPRGIAFTILGADGVAKTRRIQVPARRYRLINKGWLLREVAFAPGSQGRLL